MKGKLHQVGFRRGRTGFVADTGIEWESSGSERRVKSLNTGPSGYTSAVAAERTIARMFKSS